MSTLYLRALTRTTSSGISPLEYCFAYGASKSADNLLPNTATLTALSTQLKEARQVILLLAASDVTLLRMATPPLSASKLAAALPALVEDRLLCDPAKCVMAASHESNGKRTIAVTDRDWLNSLTSSLFQMGVRHLTVLPFQSCLPVQPGVTSASVDESDAGIELSIRLNKQESTAMLLAPDTSAHEVVQAIRFIEPEGHVNLYAPAESVSRYQQAADARTSVEKQMWVRWAANANDSAVNLMTAQGSSSPPSIDWKIWRWPLALAAAVALVNIAGLQIDWWSMKSEQQDLRNMMLQSFRSAYPQEKVIVDPLAQMRQKVAAAKNRSGQLSTDDFLSLSATFGEAWANAARTRHVPHGLPDIASVEYRERRLLIKWKKESPVSIAELQPVLAARNLSLSQVAGVWQIEAGK